MISKELEILKRYAMLIVDEDRAVYVTKKDIEPIRKNYNCLISYFLSLDRVYSDVQFSNPILVICSKVRGEYDRFSVVSEERGFEPFNSTLEYLGYCDRQGLMFELYRGSKLMGKLAPGILEPVCAGRAARTFRIPIIGLEESMRKFVIHYNEKDRRVIPLEKIMEYDEKPAIRLPSFKKLV